MKKGKVDRDGDTREKEREKRVRDRKAARKKETCHRGRRLPAADAVEISRGLRVGEVADGERERERKKERKKTIVHVCVRMYVCTFGGSMSERTRVIVVERETGTGSRLLETRQRPRREGNLGMRARARARGWSYLRFREGRQAQGPWLHHLSPLGAGHPSFR